MFLLSHLYFTSERLRLVTCAMELALCLRRSESQDGYTALAWAACLGETDSVRLLIDAGADKNSLDHVRVGNFFAGAPN